MRNKIMPVIIGITLGCLAGMCHIKSAQQYSMPIIYRSIEVEVQETVEEKAMDIDPDIPIEVQIAANKYGKEYDIVPELLEAMAFYESSYRADVDSKGCMGLMQVNPKWHKDRMERLEVTDLHDVDQNMRVAADYLKELIDEYESYEISLMVYNGDSSWKSGKRSAYAKKIIKLSKELEEKHGKSI